MIMSRPPSLASMMQEARESGMLVDRRLSAVEEAAIIERAVQSWRESHGFIAPVGRSACGEGCRFRRLPVPPPVFGCETHFVSHWCHSRRCPSSTQCGLSVCKLTGEQLRAGELAPSAAGYGAAQFFGGENDYDGDRDGEECDYPDEHEAAVDISKYRMVESDAAVPVMSLDRHRNMSVRKNVEAVLRQAHRAISAMVNDVWLSKDVRAKGFRNLAPIAGRDLIKFVEAPPDGALCDVLHAFALKSEYLWRWRVPAGAEVWARSCVATLLGLYRFGYMHGLVPHNTARGASALAFFTLLEMSRRGAQLECTVGEPPDEQTVVLWPLSGFMQRHGLTMEWLLQMRNGAPKNVVVNYEVYDAGLKMYDAILEKCRDNRNAQELARMLRPLPDETEWRAADMRTTDADSACPAPRAQRKRVRAGRR